MFNYMVAQNQNFKLRIQPKKMPGSYLSLYKFTSQNIFISADLAPDLDLVQGIAHFFVKPSNIDPHISRLQT